MAVRYDQKKKDEVVAFIQAYNEKNNGRGGQSAAAKKYKVTPITISNWLKKAGVKGANKKSGKKKGAPKRLATPSAVSSGGGGSKSKVLNRLVKIQSLIEELEDEFESLKKRL